MNPDFVRDGRIVVRQDVQALGFVGAAQARQMLLWRNGTKLKLCDAPADVTVARGSRSRDDKKAIKNGTSARLFTALSALFDVSLYFDLSDSPEP
jgi:hypothetical protein